MKVTIQTAAEFVRTGKTSVELGRLLPGSEIVDFEAERANRPPRFIEIAGEYRDGVPIVDIVKKYQCSRGTVMRYARLAGLSKRPKGFALDRRKQVLALYRDGRPIAEIAAVAGVSPAYVSKTAVEEGINRRTFK